MLRLRLSPLNSDVGVANCAVRREGVAGRKRTAKVDYLAWRISLVS